METKERATQLLKDIASLVEDRGSYIPSDMHADIHALIDKALRQTCRAVLEKASAEVQEEATGELASLTIRDMADEF